MEETKNNVLNDEYCALIIETIEGKKIAEVTPYEITAAEDIIVRLIPKID
ncbi:hypothetical protein ACV7JQ_09210 [Globicatella sulfidifaciens]